MASRQREQGTDISTFFGVLRRRALIVVLAVVVAAAAAYQMSKGQDEKYEAQSTILLRGTSNNQAASEFTPPLPGSAPDREALVLSGAVLERVDRRLDDRYGSAASEDALADVEADAGEESDVVTVTVTAGSPKVAAAAANAIVSENISSRRQSTVAKIRRAIRTVDRQLGEVRGRTDPASIGAAGQLTGRKQALAQALEQQEGDAEFVKRASVPSSPSSPKPTRDAVIGGFAGLLLGLMLALVREQLDRRVRGSKGLEETFGLPVLANVPRSRALSRGRDGKKTLGRLPAVEAEAFQMLRANLHYLNTDTELKSVVVTSAGVGDGKSTVALNLARADAAVGRKVLLVEADVRRPALGNLLGLHVTEGLAKFLGDRDVRLSDVTHSVPVVERTNGTGVPLKMDVIVSGTVPSNPSELIDSTRMRELLREAEESYDLVVIDTAPAGIVADAIPLMSEASAVVVVGRVGRITTNEANSLREQLERIDAPAFGLVANFASGPDDKGYGYY